MLQVQKLRLTQAARIAKLRRLRLAQVDRIAARYVDDVPVDLK